MPLTLSTEQCRAARALIGISQSDLCDMANVSIKTLSDFEAGKTQPHRKTIQMLRVSLSIAGVDFIEPQGAYSFGVRLRENIERAVVLDRP